VTCRDVVHLVEAIAAGDLDVAADVRSHLETCPLCASALASARRIELALQARPAPAAPERFASDVLTRIRNDRWQSEQRVDRIFNVAIALSLLLVVGSIAALTNIGGVIGIAGWVWGAIAQVSGQAAQDARPGIVTYIAAAGLLMSALLMWWWAERRLTL
jgi:anti-sigma factor RsiW